MKSNMNQATSKHRKRHHGQSVDDNSIGYTASLPDNSVIPINDLPSSREAQFQDIKKTVFPNFEVDSQYRRQGRLNKEGGGSQDFEKEKLVYHFESNSTGDAQMLVIDELPQAFKDHYNLRRLPLRFLVRKCYEDLYEVAKGIMIRHINRPAVLFTGTPGIGKSVFLLYFVCRYLSEATRPEDKRFAFETGSGIYQYFCPTEIDNEFMYFKYFEEDSYRDQSVFPLEDVLVISDIMEKALPGDPRGKWRFLFNSPDPVRHKQYLKNGPSYKFYLPTWTKEEFQMFNPNESTWIDLYNVYGGVPRYVLTTKVGDFQGKDAMNPMDEALQDRGRLIAENIFQLGSCLIIYSDTIYRLIHVNPRAVDGGQGGFDYVHSVFSVASDYVLAQLIQIDGENLLFKANRFFDLKRDPAMNMFGGGLTEDLELEKLFRSIRQIAQQTTITATTAATTHEYEKT